MSNYDLETLKEMKKAYGSSSSMEEFLMNCNIQGIEISFNRNPLVRFLSVHSWMRVCVIFLVGLFYSGIIPLVMLGLCRLSFFIFESYPVSHTTSNWIMAGNVVAYGIFSLVGICVQIKLFSRDSLLYTHLVEFCHDIIYN